MWQDILAEPGYDDVNIYPTGEASRLYARGLAYASLGKVAEAEGEQVSARASHPNRLSSGHHACHASRS